MYYKVQGSFYQEKRFSDDFATVCKRKVYCVLTEVFHHTEGKKVQHQNGIPGNLGWVRTNFRDPVNIAVSVPQNRDSHSSSDERIPKSSDEPDRIRRMQIWDGKWQPQRDDVPQLDYSPNCRFPKSATVLLRQHCEEKKRVKIYYSTSKPFTVHYHMEQWAKKARKIQCNVLVQQNIRTRSRLHGSTTDQTERLVSAQSSSQNYAR